MNKLSQTKEKLKRIQLFIETIEGEDFSNIEKDILLEKIRNLYEIVLGIDAEVKITGKFEKQEKEVEKIFEDNKEVKTPPIEEMIQKTDPVKSEKQEIFDIEFIEESIDIERHQNKQTEQKQTIKESEPVKKEESTIQRQTLKQTSLFNGNTTTVKTVGETLGQDKTALNEIIGKNKQQKDLITKLNLKPISDIKSAIGIGDRFLYIRELFNNDKDLFEQVLNHLNNLKNYEEALEYINSNFNWNFSDENVVSFLTIVRRRYL
ncbi:MAG: hypothetical protein WHW07_08820 [Bacteroidales bacterium]|jgi:hypothetical protein|nr:hypothetical protein [Bacteroidales bacterium]HOL96988.1 hypothetical protein [Bacteroidales bacterium]HOM36295.1 hypothetical protein [Bacteroidales bacterium]HPD23781.1 hypothetical protein [Bacteroidales bacterium]HRS98673.1 hypothetical protein [Bacteroidales bacterium]